MTNQRALFILTSHDTLGETGKPTGFYWEELAIPYWTLQDDDVLVDIASVQGGGAPADPTSDDADERPVQVQRFMNDENAMHALKNTLAIKSVDVSAYDLIFIPGGHGTMWDLAQTAAVGAAICNAFEQGSIIGSVCHGPAALTDATLSNGESIVKGMRITAFTDAEERAVELDGVVPYMLESRLRELGALFERSSNDFESFAVRDGQLITGQNPASSAEVAELMVAALKERHTDSAALQSDVATQG